MDGRKEGIKVMETVGVGHGLYRWLGWDGMGLDVGYGRWIYRWPL